MCPENGSKNGSLKIVSEIPIPWFKTKPYAQRGLKSDLLGIRS